MPNASRGEVWQIDFGLAAKVRPVLVLGCDIAEEDRVLVAVVYHTTALRGSRYEAPMNVPGLLGDQVRLSQLQSRRKRATEAPWLSWEVTTLIDALTGRNTRGIRLMCRRFC